MKNSIKREQSHARMSFAEYENQRSLAEGESNVRATLKHMKLSFNLILTLVAMLTMAQMATAGTTTETRTMTWPMNGTGVSGSEVTNSAGERLVLSIGTWKANNTTTKILHGGSLIGTEISFPNIVGKVTKVELKNVQFCQNGMCLKAGKDNNTLLCSTTFASYYDENMTSYTDFTFTGSLDVTASLPLKLMFMTAPGETAPEAQGFKFNNGSITVTYEVEVEEPAPEDPGHNFSFNVSGNTLTATCNQQSQYHNCGLTGGKATLTLSVEDCTGNGDFTYNPASINLAEFNQQTGLQATKGDITYTNNTTGQTTTLTSQVSDVGSYTASVTVTIGGNNYTLTKDFSILAGYKVNNNYSQFSVSKTSALEGDEITITYTQQMDEILEGLTLTGATSGNSIAYTQSSNTYTFTMPAEDVTINATITYPLNENNITQSDDIYTIKNADGWNYFCRRMEVDGGVDGFSGKTIELADDISVTKMAGMVHPFKGTFDGKGKTLTFNHTASAPYSAPFQNTNGATIRNLHATGQIEGGIWNYIGGLVGSANGNLTIENCRVSTLISSTISGTAFNGGFVGLLSSHYNQCHITGCVFDGLIYNPEYSGTTYGCGGFVGCFSEYGYAILEDCLFLHGQYDNNNGKHELWWGNENDKNSTFLHRTNNQGSGKLTNCFYVGTRGLKQGSPAVESADAPDNFVHFGAPTTDHGFLKVYGHTMVFDGKYYTPIYGDLVEHYDYSGVKSYIIEYDDAPLGIPDITSPLWTECLRYNRSFIAGKPVTIMLPFNFTRDRITLAHDNANPSGKFYEFKGTDNSGNPIMDEGNEVMENTLQANHPYLYVPGESTEYWDTYVSSGINIFTQDNGGGSKGAEYDGFEMRGTYTEKVWEENDPEIGKAYVYNDNGELTAVTAGTKIRPTECYILKTKTRMTDMGITVTIEPQTWTGSAIEPAVTVKDGETTLTLGTDYEVAYSNNVNAGTATVTITGKGNYSDSKEATFTISPRLARQAGAVYVYEDQNGMTALLDGTSVEAVDIDFNHNIIVNHVTSNRVFTPGKPATVMLPFNYTCNGEEGGTFYKFVGVEKEENQPWVATMQETGNDVNNEGTLIANTPYLFMPAATTMTFPNINGSVRLFTRGDGSGGNCETADPGSHWTFKGTYEYMKWTTDTSDPYYNSEREAEIGRVYGFAGVAKTGIEVGDFVKAKSGARIRPMTCYLMWNDTPNNTRSMTRGTIDELPSSIVVRLLSNVGPGNQDDDDNQGGTTAIGTLDTETGEIDFGGWYDMSGRKLSAKPTQKGLYIHNGKKVIIK